MNLKSAWLHFQQLQALPAFRLSPRWQEQVNNNLWWACLPDLINTCDTQQIHNLLCLGQETAVGRAKVIPLCCTLPFFPWAMEYEDPHLHTHTVCLHEGQGTGKHPGCCSLLLIHHCVSKCSFPAPSNGLVLRQRQQTCNFSFLFIRAQKAIQVLSMWCSLAPWGSAKHGKPRWKLSGTVRLVPPEGIPSFQGDSPIPPGAHC